MNKTLFYFLLFLLIFWLIAGTIFFKNRICGVSGATNEKEKTTTVVPPPVTKEELLIADGAAFKTTASNYFDFNKSSNTYLTPLATGLTSSLAATATYLKANPNRSMTITGHYKEEEENESIFPDLGYARAIEIKNALSDLGVPAQQLIPEGSKLGAGVDFKDGVLYNAASFSFKETTDDLAERLAAIKARLAASPITLYFKTGEQNVNLTGAQRTDISDLVFYLDNVSDSSLEVGGHTDNTGDLATNTRLSRKRAEFIRDYLTTNGLDAKRLSAKGYGPDSPISDNASSTGRAKNRRVEVLLK